MTARKFRRKPVTVQAVQFDGTEESAREFAELGGGKFFGLTINPRSSESYVSVTFKGVYFARNFIVGYWAFKDADGHGIIMTDADFRAQYEPVEPDAG